MKVTRLIALLVAAFFVLIPATAANAYGPGGAGGVVVTQPPTPSGNGCSTTTIVVNGEPGDRLTLTVRNSAGVVVYSKTKAAGSDGSASFKVRVCESGTFTATGTNQDGQVLGSSQFTVQGGNGQGGGAAGGAGTTPTTGSASGNLPDTGSDSGTMLTLIGALALLMVGGVTLVAAKRKTL